MPKPTSFAKRVLKEPKSTLKMLHYAHYSKTTGAAFSSSSTSRSPIDASSDAESAAAAATPEEAVAPAPRTTPSLTLLIDPNRRPSPN